MKRRLICVLLCVLVLVPTLAVTAYANCGPKPSTTVTVHGGGERMIMTLLGEQRGSGPYSEIQTKEEPSDDLTEIQQEAWRAFQSYEDPDGYCFWGEMESGGINWGYCPPEIFKIAVYYPGYDVLLVSEEVFERYAFHSDFRVYLPAVNENTQSGVINMELSGGFDWMEELLGFLCRAALTLVIELSMARVWGFDGKAQQKLILKVNLLTQVGLNVLLWLWYFYSGPLTAMLRLIIAEVVVLAVELTVYHRHLREMASGLRVTAYTVCANLASVLIGFLLLA